MDKQRKTILIQIGLLFLTIVTTTLAGAEWIYGRFLFFGDDTMRWSDFEAGLQYSIPLLLILSFHEFGHYFTARYHKIKVTLPYYIPLWLGLIGSISLGTMGALIRIKEHINNRKKYFDVGVSGPVAGFIIAMFVIWYGFTNLPEKEYIYQIHPEYETYGYGNSEPLNDEEQHMTMKLGDNLIFWYFRNYVADQELVPPMSEMYHYPILLAGYIALLFTALNLLPIGQLDGGHIIYGLFGKKNHRIIARVLFTAFIFYAGLGIIDVRSLENTTMASMGEFALYLGLYIYFLYASSFSMFERTQDRWFFAVTIMTGQFLLSSFFHWQGYSGWLLFAFLVGRVLGVDHPKTREDEKLDFGRQLIGWLALIIFIVSFTPRPLILEVPDGLF
ncbi:MAG: site-2 protease family protein [Bacteroidota bacterium]